MDTPNQPPVPATDVDPDKNARLTTDEVAFIEWFTGEKWEGGAA